MFHMSRKQRREYARLNNIKFEPIYNDNSPISYNERYGVGIERFSNKFVKFPIDSSVTDVVLESKSEAVLQRSESIGINTVNDSVMDTTKETGLLSRIKNSFKKGRR